ncbi:Nitrate transporter [Lentibacillus sp. JNUCC-1]|nr:Nitrate transporter [Lentibacillus sp. JNUCC-1]
MLWYSVGALAVAVSVGVGNGTVFKLVPLYFSKQSGIVNGIVSAMGGLGGFFPPLLLTTVFNITGHYAIAFMLLSELAIVCFVIVIFMYYQEKVGLEKNIIESLSDGVMLTDKNGVIQEVNTAFTNVTGYDKDEVIGEKPSILSSGKHDAEYYADMWRTIERDGYWNGEIWNKRKDGEVYKEKITINAIENSTGEVKFYAGMFTEIK